MSETTPIEKTKKVPITKPSTIFKTTFSSPILLFHVGPDKSVLRIHRDVIAAKSTFFKEHYGLAEGIGSGEILVTLPDDDPDELYRFVRFLYRSYYRLAQYSISWDKITMHTRMYFLGEKYRAPQLQGYALGEIYDLFIASRRTDLAHSERLFLLIQNVYTNTSSTKDELRKLLMANFSLNWTIFRDAKPINGEIDPGSELATFMRDYLRFAQDLLMHLRSSVTSPGRPSQVQQPAPVVAGNKRKHEADN